MKKLIVQHLKSSEGSTIIVALLMLVALSLAVFMAMENSLTDSKMMRSTRLYRDHLYRAETIISVAAEEHKDIWLDSASVLFDLSSGSAQVDRTDVGLEDVDGNTLTVGDYSVARIENSPQSGSLSEEFYHLPHQAPPPIGSGYSSESFEIRRYGVFSTGRSNVSVSRQVTLQTGLLKMFNKS